MDDDWFIPISASINIPSAPTMLVHTSPMVFDNAHTVEGLCSTNADSVKDTAGSRQVRSVYLYSARYGLTGKADLIEEQSGEIYPVEYKDVEARG
jgi:hypothetical protein